MYRRQPRKSYQRNRRPWTNPSTWTEGFHNALQQAEKLAKDGWIIDVDEGALTPEEADMATMEAQRRGFESKVIPVAEVDGEVVAQFVAIKRADGAPVEEEAATAAEPAEDLGLTVEEAEAQFLQLFYKGQQPDDDKCTDSGVIMTQDRIMAFVRRDATPTTVKSTVDKVRTLLQHPAGNFDNESIQALQYAKKQGKTIVALGSSGQEEYFQIDKLVKGLRGLSGKRGKINVAVGIAKGYPLALGNTTGDMIMLAPTIPTSTPHPTITTYNDALSAYRTKT